ncbi:MAG: hypothetical protein ACC661_08160, partial [Verrucomicrobiales bacterium]
AMVTVDGRKTSWSSPNAEIGRYIVHGNDDRNFSYATTIRGNAGLAGGKNLLKAEGAQEGEKDEGKQLVVTSPRDEESISRRLPLIEVDLSKLEGVDPGSIQMTISGLGWVPARYDAATGRLSYQMQQRLRARECSVYVRLKRASEEQADVIAWKFFLDKVPHYIPEDVTESASPEAAAEDVSKAVDPIPPVKASGVF